MLIAALDYVNVGMYLSMLISLLALLLETRVLPSFSLPLFLLHSAYCCTIFLPGPWYAALIRVCLCSCTILLVMASVLPNEPAIKWWPAGLFAAPWLWMLVALPFFLGWA